MVIDAFFPKTKPVAKFTSNIDIQPCENGFIVTVDLGFDRGMRGKRYVAKNAASLALLIENIVEGTA